MKMINKAAVKRLEKMAYVNVKKVRLWELSETGRTPLGRQYPGFDAAIYADSDDSKFHDIEINWVTPDPPHPSVRPGQESAKIMF
jgi:hypothetical protein